MRYFLTLLALVMSLVTEAQSIVGFWRTIDDASGEEKSVVEIYEKGGKIHGKVMKIHRTPGEDPDPVCDQCPADDARYKKKIIGMEIIQNMVKDDEEYTEGTILDPEVGKVYRCKLWIEGNELKVRGYWGPFYRTQTWKRTNSPNTH
jgi:uncharacterized protein (DUF2147 family)